LKGTRKNKKAAILQMCNYNDFKMNDLWRSITI